jgi:hypothetical protein
MTIKNLNPFSIILFLFEILIKNMVQSTQSLIKLQIQPLDSKLTHNNLCNIFQPKSMRGYKKLECSYKTQQMLMKGGFDVSSNFFIKMAFNTTLMHAPEDGTHNDQVRYPLENSSQNMILQVR